MKITSKIVISIMLCFTLLLAVGMIKSEDTLAETNPIMLCSAKINPIYERGALVGYYSTGYVKTTATNFPAELTIHYSYNNTNWEDTVAQYLGKANDGNHVWSYKTKEIYPSFHYYDFLCRFAIKYKTNGQTYWDNNNNNDYIIRMTNVPNKKNIPYLLKNCTVKLDSAKRITGNNVDKINGNIILKSIAYYKEVRVIYTLDNWNTRDTVYASYNTMSDNDIENWSFTINNLPVDKEVQFFISYLVNGNTYYDSNFGVNYKR